MSDLSNKVKAAIERLKAFAPKDGDKYYCCYSGGKDSDCIRILAALAGGDLNLTSRRHHKD